MADEPTFDILKLWTADAIVLHAWISSLDFDRLPISHRAEKQALVDLLGCLQTYTAAEYATEMEVEVARQQVSENMGW